MQAEPASVHPAEPVQRVVKIRRDYNAWVASETLEDHALRFTPVLGRRWSALQVANMAFGASSFLVLEAVGATLLVEYGFINAMWAILATGLIIMLVGWPISVYAARYGLDMDLLTRGAGFGYIGSTITSLIYASFTFIFFALEAAIMAYALDLAFDIPPAWGYLLCALVVLPLVTHGVTVIARLQAWTQPLWLFLLIVPYVFVFKAHPGIATELGRYAGVHGTGGTFNLKLFGAAMTVGIALITQMGEQADYLRFMPEPKTGGAKNWHWWVAVFAGGTGWVIPGVAKMLGGALLAYLALQLTVPAERVVDPNQMYLVAFDHVFSRPSWSVAATALLVIVSQLKINVTNAYAGSLAWSNFFARLTHSHPGRVVWVVFNTAIALLLMEMELLRALDRVLGLFANIAIAWIMSVVADLVINKPLGLSPPGIEFKRAHLYDINPVGVGAMAIASMLSVSAHLGLFGPMARAFSALIALVTAFVCAPLIAWATKGRYYIARQSEKRAASFCCICEREYEGPDMAHCPAYKGPICSLCCSLDARCDDLCKPQARLADQALALFRKLTPRRLWPLLDGGLVQYVGLMLLVTPVLLLFARLGELALLMLAGVLVWWLVLAHKSRQVAQEESRRQSQALFAEIESHRRTDSQLQAAKARADAVSQAKTRYITAVSHELRTPLNGILGYAQILDADPSMPAHRRQAVKVIRRGGEHLLSLIDASLDLARIEAGRMRVEAAPWAFSQGLDDLVRLLAPQAAAKGLAFDYAPGELPLWVRGDAKRLQQVLINLVGNAIKFTSPEVPQDRVGEPPCEGAKPSLGQPGERLPSGRVRLSVQYAREMARFEIEDSGPGMTAAELKRMFEPFERGSGGAGTGLGLTIAQSLTELMGGEMKVSSQPGRGTRFELRFFLPRCEAGAVRIRRERTRLIGPPRRLLLVDNEEADCELLRSLLAPLGFELRMACSGAEALTVLKSFAAEALLLDLAMPGMDGWQTLAAIREQGLSAAPAAIVSANAFDRGLDNGLGILERDFILKPLRVDELLDWLESHLQLSWEAPPPSTSSAVQISLPPTRERLVGLQEQLAKGHVKGIHQMLDLMAPETPDFAAELRALAREFQMQALGTRVAQALQGLAHEP